MNLSGIYLDKTYEIILNKLHKEEIIKKKQEISINNKKKLKESSKRDKFIELSNKRLSKALKAIKLLENLSNKYHYLPNSGDLDFILKTCKNSCKFNLNKFK